MSVPMKNPGKYHKFKTLMVFLKDQMIWIDIHKDELMADWELAVSEKNLSALPHYSNYGGIYGKVIRHCQC